MSITHRALGVMLVLAFSGLLSLPGCGGGGPYGFSRTYAPLPSEKGHFKEARQLTYQDVIREPNAYRDVELGWFGVVKDMQEAPDGRVRLTLTLRSHQTRHLCAEESKASCRVTVSEAELGTFTADVTLRPEEREGKERVWQGSLFKVYGTPTGEYSAETGPVLEVTYHRHWPRGYYVTTAARSVMRR